MRHWIATALCAATIACILVSAATADTFVVQLNERDRQYRNTGVIILRDPMSETVLGTYEFATGGHGRGSAPFGLYEIGAFRGVNDDPHHIGSRWMIRQLGQPEDGQAYDPRLKDTRTQLELHAAKRRAGTYGCIAVLGGQSVWNDFMRNLGQILNQVGRVAFVLTGNPQAAPATAESVSFSAAPAHAPRKRGLHPPQRSHKQ